MQCWGDGVMQKNKKHKIRLTPEDQNIFAEHGQTLLEALIAAGIFLRADCGGKQRCGKCMLKISEPEVRCGKCMLKISEPEVAAVSPPEKSEISFLGEKELENGSRLACCVEVLDDVLIEIPATSRLSPEVAQKGPTILFDKLSALKPASTAGAGQYGLAVDLGTTTIAVYLCNLAATEVTASISVRNPQVLFGDDVMSRIGAVGQQEDLLFRLQKMVIKAIEWGTNSLSKRWSWWAIRP
jgi:uncharacterized 2Fe-2S/4Fe-4S cluster protein (DUF4445 family)